MTDWLDGIGDAHLITAKLPSMKNLPTRGELVRFEPRLLRQRIKVVNSAGLAIAEVLDEKAVLFLRHMLETDRSHVAEVARLIPAESQIHIRISQPTEITPIADSLQLVISNKIRKRILNLCRKEMRDIEVELEDWLNDQFVWHGQYLVFSRHDQQSDRLLLLSPYLKFECEIRNQGAFLRVISTKKFPRREQEKALRRAGLIDAQVVWLTRESDAPVVQGALNLLQAAQSKSEYFDIWEQYRTLELQTTVEIAKTLPQLTYRQLKYRPDVIRFYLDKGNQTQLWTDYSGSLSVELLIPRRSKSNSDDAQQERTIPLGTVRRIEPDFLDVDRPDDELGLPNRGQLRASAIGDAVRLTRQAAALERLKDGVGPIPRLERLLATGETDEIKTYPVSGFGNPPLMADGRSPNPRQKDAVEMSLNTPDICVIQGPPGTGKTTVIRTIVRHLKDEGRRQLLISSHQHTAVDNALDGLQGCGVVPYRYGGNQNTQSYRNDELENWVAEITQNVAANIKQVAPDDNLHTQRLNLSKVIDTAATQSDLASCVRLLETVPNDYHDVIPMSLRDQAESLRLAWDTLQITQSPQPTTKNNVRKLTRLVESLPETEDDSGISVLKRIKPELERLSRGQPADQTLAKQYQMHIKEVDNWQIKHTFGDNPEEAEANLKREFQAARQIAVQFLEKYSAPADSATPTVATSDVHRQWHKKFQTWCQNVSQIVAQDATASQGQIPAILQQWLLGLKTRSGKVEVLFRKHADVWGVTCQQSVAMRFGLYDEEFDCVIVDEAARTSPLDLLIPLTRARRIVLVGDQMQLPHMLEYRLEKEFEAASKDETAYKNFLKQSLFERLYDQLPKSKRIRLNTQYRMNPVISRLVSELFYADDPLEDDDSTRNLVNDTQFFQGHSLVWLDVVSKPNQRLEKGQFYNQAEVDQVVSCVDQLIKTETRYSIGVITYYAQQRDQIQRALADQVPGSGRIQVGTVDAFQGEEKDVILLSMVRSNPDKRVGFLQPNRINVSLSRARRLLVIIGDSQTVTASSYLKKAYAYCQRQGVISKV